MLPLTLAALLFHPAALVPVLGSEDFAARAAAYATLDAWGDAALPVLRRHADHPDIEVRRAVTELLCAGKRRALERLAPYPCIDALWYDTRFQGYDADLLTYPLAVRYLDARGRDPYPYRQYAYATIDLISDLLDAGVPECVLRVLLAEMRRRDGMFLSKTHPQKEWWAEVFIRP